MDNNFKKLVIVLVLAVFALSACTPERTPPEIEASIQQPLLQFPGTEWNMTPEELTASLLIQDSERIENARVLGERHISFGIKSRKFLGEEAIIMFEFYDSPDSHDESGSHHGLRQVCVFFPETADPDVLIQQLNTMLGEGFVPEGKSNTIWSSDAAYSDFLSEDDTSFQPDIPAVHITLYPSLSQYTPQYLLPSDDNGQNYIVLLFYANYHPLLQHESNR